jgi:hypothetical protein
MSYRTTRHLLLVLSLILPTSSLVFAQSDYSARPATTMLTIGPMFAGGASITMDAVEGFKVKPIFAFQVGVDATYPLTTTISATLGLGYESRGTEIHPYNSSEQYADYRYTYFHFTPAFILSAFYVGVNFGVPLGASVTTPGGSQSFSAADEEKINFLVEPRAGVVIPVTDQSWGWVGVSLIGGYPLSELSDRGDKPAGLDSDVWGNFHHPALYLGTTVQFSIPNTNWKK